MSKINQLLLVLQVQLTENRGSTAMRAISVLVLCLTTAGCVVGIIYMANRGPMEITCPQVPEQRKATADMHANVNMKSKNLQV